MLRAITEKLNGKAFFAGLVGGLVLCAFLGRIASGYGRLENFHRFFYAISPEAQFFPTIAQLRNTALSLAPETKILVLVGSSSVFRGLGQNPDELWTDELQRLLGHDYRVVNFAMNHAEFLTFGSVAFRVISATRARVVFVTLSANPFDHTALDGNVHNYLFWDAYYKGLLKLSADEQAQVESHRKQQLGLTFGRKLHLGAVLDSLLYFTDLWEFVTYEYASTIYTPTGHCLFLPRKLLRDEPTSIFASVQQNVSRDPSLASAILSSMSYYGIGFAEEGHRLIPDAAFWQQVERKFGRGLPVDLRQKTLAVRLYENPAFVSKLPPASRQAHEATIEMAATIMRRVGYNVAVVGAKFQPTDFLDGGHLMPSGGRKLARELVPHIRSLADRRGYFTDRPPEAAAANGASLE